MISILVPLDGSELAEGVLPCVEDLAERLHAEVHFVQAIDPRAESAAFTAEIGLINQQMEDDAREAERYLSKLAEDWRAKGIDVKWEVTYGPPARALVNFARSHKCAMIAMSTHGRSGLSRMVFGSVADEVLREAGIPVLLIKPGQKADREPIRLYAPAEAPEQQKNTRTVA